jgi:hypothetical protein
MELAYVVGGSVSVDQQRLDAAVAAGGEQFERAAAVGLGGVAPGESGSLGKAPGCGRGGSAGGLGGLGYGGGFGFAMSPALPPGARCNSL